MGFSALDPRHLDSPEVKTGEERTLENVHPLAISIVVPCRNEAGHITNLVRDILNQEPLLEGRTCEILIADGMSDDGTREGIEALARTNSSVRLVDNPGRIVSTGLNAAIRASQGEIIVRMDVHTQYATDYVRQCVAVLKETGADNVGGPARTRARSLIQRAVAAAYHSPFSVGGARFHDPDHEGEVDTVTYGCWRRETLRRVGEFDEELIRNQDDEHNLRIRLAGGRIWQSPRIVSWYYPRASLAALFRQYFQYGYWKVRVIQKHGRPASARHLVPVLFVIGVLTGWAAGFVHPWLGLAYGGGLALYGVLSMFFSARAAAENGWDLLPVLPLVFLIYHISYGLGFGLGLLDFVVLGRGERAAMTTLTRPIAWVVPAKPPMNSEAASRGSGTRP
jgi:succinoglycan biosynthesis protein ExoA